MVGRLEPGVTPEQAQQDAGRVARQITRNFPTYMSSQRIGAMVRPLAEDTVAQAHRPRSVRRGSRPASFHCGALRP